MGQPAMEGQSTEYLIWSFKHSMWWAPLRQGYTPHIHRAGRYDAIEAGDIVTNSVLCESIAIYEPVALQRGQPTVTGLWMELPKADT